MPRFFLRSLLGRARLVGRVFCFITITSVLPVLYKGRLGSNT